MMNVVACAAVAGPRIAAARASRTQRMNVPQCETASAAAIEWQMNARALPGLARFLVASIAVSHAPDAPVAQLDKSTSLLSLGSQVRVLPGAPRSAVECVTLNCPLSTRAGHSHQPQNRHKPLGDLLRAFCLRLDGPLGGLPPQEIGYPSAYTLPMADHQMTPVFQDAQLRAANMLCGKSCARQRVEQIILGGDYERRHADLTERPGGELDTAIDSDTANATRQRLNAADHRVDI